MKFSNQFRAMAVSAIIVALLLGAFAGYTFCKLQEGPPAVSTHTPTLYSSDVAKPASQAQAVVEVLDATTAARYRDIVTQTVAPKTIIVSGGGAKLVITKDVPADADVIVEGGSACLIVFGAVDNSAKLTVRGGGAKIILVSAPIAEVDAIALGSAEVLDSTTGRNDPRTSYDDDCSL